MPKDGSVNREHLLSVAERLVIDNGFSATSVNDVIAAAGSSKGAFFHHFASKGALAEALVQRYAAADLEHLRRALDAVTGIEDPVARVDAFLGYFVDEAELLMSAQSYCLYVAALTERELIQTGTSAPIREAVLGWRDALTELLRAALPVTGKATELDCEAWADHVFVTFEGAFILCRAMEDNGHMKAQLAALRTATAAMLR